MQVGKLSAKKEEYEDDYYSIFEWSDRTAAIEHFQSLHTKVMTGSHEFNSIHSTKVFSYVKVRVMNL